MIPSKEKMDEELVKRHGAVLQEKIAGTAVAVCGLGGLGSNIAIALARAGIGRLLLYDFDAVDVSNLHRQQYEAEQIGQPKAEALAANIRKIAPYVSLDARRVKITEENGPELLKEADIVCEAFDEAEQKAMLANLVLEAMPEKYLVAASGMAGIGDANRIQTKQITERFYLCGDGVSDVEDGMGLFSTRVLVCAAHQAHAVIRIIAQRPENQESIQKN